MRLDEIKWNSEGQHWRFATIGNIRIHQAKTPIAKANSPHDELVNYEPGQYIIGIYKAGEWNRWYRKLDPIAAQAILYELEAQGLIRGAKRGTGNPET